MLPRKNLIPLKKEFPRIRAEGKMYDSPSFGLVVSYHSSINYQLPTTNSSCAFVVSKKISKSSVVRHSVKRKLSDAIVLFLPRLPKNIELLFLAKSKSITATRDDLKKEVENVLLRAKLLK